MAQTGRIARGMGWLPDWPDIRDYTAQHELIAPLLTRARMRAPQN